MDVQVQMQIWGDEIRHRVFHLIAFHAGRIQKHFRQGAYWWTESIDDKSVMPLAHIMERAFKLNHLVIFKQPDDATQSLIKAHLQREKLDTQIHINIGRGENAMWQGTYGFDFKIEEYYPNQANGEGQRWEVAHLKIINGTERRMFT